ncbi:MAG: NAD(P)H-dependent oxidoreductase [Bacteroidetes bacterium]|nr:NAD(P)H-dependent oxidoreductase [Bacteroidota bacterium]
MKKILAICGSTRKQSVNSHILSFIAEQYAGQVLFTLYAGIDQLPHFNPDLDKEPFPDTVVHFRKLIGDADGILICTPEYVFSLPGSFKNAIEWTVSTTLFTNKPAALITASSSGQKAHEALHLVMKTLGAQLSAKSSLLISAPKTKISPDGQVTDTATEKAIRELADDLIALLNSVEPEASS